MKKTLALLVIASALPLAAQNFEVGLTYHWNPSRTNTLSSGGSSVDVKADNWKAAGLRFGYVFYKNGIMDIQGDLAYQFKNKQDLTVGGAPYGTITEEYGYWGVGAAVNWNLPVRLGVGLDYRSEKITLGDPPQPQYDNHGTTYGRPWIRGEASYAFNAGATKPFIGLDAAFPLTSSSTIVASDFSTPNIDNINKGVAPKAEYGIHLGVRF